MKIYTYLVILILAILSQYQIQAQAPNIILIIADDVGWSQVSTGAMNLNNSSDFYETPTLEMLASEGIAFPYSYVNGANCAPTRAAILSGQYGSRPTNNVFAVSSLNRGGDSTLLVGPSQGILTDIPQLPHSTITMAETIKSAGYTTAHFGKYHVGGFVESNIPEAQGFDYNYGGNEKGGPGSYFAAMSGDRWEFHDFIDSELDIYATPYSASQSLLLTGTNSLTNEKKHITDALAEAAIDFMNLNNTSPFFMHFSTYATHKPISSTNARPDLYAKYVSKNNTTPSQMGHNNIGLAAITEGLDQTIGRIINYLKTTPDPRNPGHMLSVNTLVYFISDNGSAFGSDYNGPLRGMKGEYYEGGIRSTTVVWSEGLLANAGVVNNTPILATDLYPTFVEMAGGNLPVDYIIDGTSQWSLLNGSNPNLNRTSLFWHFPGYLIDVRRNCRPVSIIRKGDLKLIYNYETETYELYHLINDISETNNLLLGDTSAAYIAIGNELSKELRNHLIEVNAPLPTFRNNGDTVSLPYIINSCTLLNAGNPDPNNGCGVTAKILLEGFYDSENNSMRTNLEDKNLLPLSQPFNTAPWNYNGTESTASIPSGVTDWILIATRDNNGDMINQAAGFINQTGALISTDGNLGIPIPDAVGKRISVHHKSHLAVISSSPYDGVIYDFTTAVNQADGTEQLKLIDGKYMLYSGDYDNTGIINSKDFNKWKIQGAVLNQYLNIDGDGNGIINSLDFNLWQINKSKVGQPSIRY